MLINLERRRVLSSLTPTNAPDLGNNSNPKQQQQQQQQQNQLGVARKLDIMRTFFRNTVGPIFQDTFIPSPHAIDHNGGKCMQAKTEDRKGGLIIEKNIFADLATTNVCHVQLPHLVNETYLCSDYHKCLAVQHQQYQIFVIFIPAVPNHSMR